MKTNIIVVNTIDDLDKIRLVPDGNKIIILIRKNLKFNNSERFISINKPNSDVIVYGGSHTIYDLNIESDGNKVGLFSEVKNLYVRNLYFHDVTIKGHDEVGALVGTTNKLNAKDLGFSGSIEGYEFVGSLVGSCESIVVENTDVFTDVKANDIAGGVVGITKDYREKNLAIFSNIQVEKYVSNRSAGMVFGKKKFN